MHQTSSTDTSKLPVQLLAKILQHAGPQQALQSCALVCRAWQEAAALSVASINIKNCDQDKATSLTHWLQANNVAVQDITVERQCHLMVCPELQLPATQLLRVGSIRLHQLRVTAAAAEQDVIDPAPWDVSGLTALTRLELHRCWVGLQGLSALTGLQALAVRHNNYHPSVVNPDNVSVLAASVPLLQHLTSLRLGGVVCNDAVLAHVSRLTRLQDLELSECACTADSFQQLPQSLTRLVMDYSAFGLDSLVVSATSTPGVCQLPALQDLTVSCNDEVDIAVVGTLTALTRLALRATGIVAAPDGPRLVVLTALTNLQHLLLRSQSSERPAAITPDDFAAITASQQLTFLDLSQGPIGDVGQLHTAFPAQPRLLHLQVLKLDDRWLLDPTLMGRVVTCCPNLRSITMQYTGADIIPDVEAAEWARGLAPLKQLSGLTSLVMLTMDMEFGPPVWAAIAALTGLRRLQIEELMTRCLASILALQACRQLEELHVGGAPIVEGDFSLHIANKAPKGSPPDVWCQLPHVLLQAAVDNRELFSLSEPASAQELLEAAAVACGQLLAAQSELQQHNHSLEQQVANLQKELEQRTSSLQQQVTGLQAEMQQQVAGLKADMAAVLAHLQLQGSTGR